MSKQEGNTMKWHEIYRIKPDGEREFAASYDGKFSVYYAMQLWWCNLHKCSFFCKQNLKKATKQITAARSMRSVMFDHDGNTYILSTKNGRNVMEGVSGCPEYEYNLKVRL